MKWLISLLFRKKGIKSDRAVIIQKILLNWISEIKNAKTFKISEITDKIKIVHIIDILGPKSCFDEAIKFVEFYAKEKDGPRPENRLTI